jgi:hypothetical protein
VTLPFVRLASILELEEHKYQEVANDPFEDERQEHRISHLLDLVRDHEDIFEKVVACAVSNKIELSTSSMRLLVVCSLLETFLECFSEEELNAGVAKVLEWVKESPLAQRCQATGGEWSPVQLRRASCRYGAGQADRGNCGWRWRA